MFRKLILALGAVAAIGAASLTPTVASAHGWHGYHHGHGPFWGGHFGYGVYPAFVAGGDCYMVRKLVSTPYGLVSKRVMVCD